jgi:hypothetical protein
MATRLPLETQTLHAELLEHLLGVEAGRSLGRLPGGFTTKAVKGVAYLYFQASVPGGKTRQFYLGRKTPALERLALRLANERSEIAPDLERVQRLAAQLRAGGAAAADAATARVIRGLADAGVFHAGAVLVGTHALAVLGNLLGVRWGVAVLRTQDVDVGSARDPDIDLAVADAKLDVPAVLDSLKMGFLPVPALDPKRPTTSYKVRGQALRVDLLCPKRGSADAPVFIPRLGAAAQPLGFLDYLLESPERGVLLGGGATLVNVPAPARFALHKLLVAPLRPVAWQAKASKDLAQAGEVIATLLEDRPGDLGLAWQALAGRGPQWKKAAERGIAAFARHTPSLCKQLKAVL